MKTKDFCSGQTPTRRLVLSLLAALSPLIFAPSAFASNITIASPLGGSTVTSPIWVRAHNVGCNGQVPTAFGFSFDSSSTTKLGATPYDIDLTGVSISSGSHTIHFKSWTGGGVCPVVSVSFNVGGSSSTSGTTSSGTTTGTSIPSYATASSDLDTIGWQYEHDWGTPGSSKGSTYYPASTPLYDDAREFYMTYTDHGGERWHLSWANAASPTHFIFDTYVFVKNPDQMANLELDINQVMSNGETVILGTQCSSYSGTWEYVYVSSGKPHWHSSNIHCNTRKWAANTWHHIQIGMHRGSSSSYVTHDWVTLDGTKSYFSGASGSAGLWLGWSKGSLTTNYQVDGAYSSSGSVTSYIHKMTIYRW
jgi:hypothetical protein